MSKESALRRAECVALLAVAVLIGTTASPAIAQCGSDEQQQLTAPSGKTLDAFGRAVSISGDLAMISASAESSKGVVYAYQRLGGAWSPIQRVTPSDHEPVDLFGFSGMIQGTTMIIGNPFDDDGAIDAGSAVVFEFDGAEWVEGQELTPSTPVESGQFGWSLAMDGDVVVVGAIGDDEPGTNNTGAAFVFRYDGASWVEEQKLTVGPVGDFYEFGFRVAIGGDVIVVSSPNDDDAGTDAGAAYVFRYDGANWNEERKLIGSDSAAGDFFGWSLAVEGDLLAVGATNHDLPVDSAGALYLFEWNGAVWNETAKITPREAGPFELFGTAVDLEGDRMVVGAGGADDFGGGLYLFQNVGSQWVESYLWTGSGAPGSGFLNDSLGHTVALDGSLVLGGAPFADGNQSDAGAAYAYEVTDLAIAVMPEAVQVGDKLRVHVCGGLPGAAVRVYVASFAGNATKRQIGNGAFDAEGRFATTLAIPPSFGGNEVGFAASGYWQPGVQGTSGLVTIDVEP